MIFADIDSENRRCEECGGSMKLISELSLTPQEEEIAHDDVFVCGVCGKSTSPDYEGIVYAQILFPNGNLGYGKVIDTMANDRYLMQIIEPTYRKGEIIDVITRDMKRDLVIPRKKLA